VHFVYFVFDVCFFVGDLSMLCCSFCSLHFCWPKHNIDPSCFEHKVCLLFVFALFMLCHFYLFSFYIFFVRIIRGIVCVC
jgi:hypothetical protein